MNTDHDTIVAPATAAGGAIAVIRISGGEAFVKKASDFFQILRQHRKKFLYLKIKLYSIHVVAFIVAPHPLRVLSFQGAMTAGLCMVVIVLTAVKLL